MYCIILGYMQVHITHKLCCIPYIKINGSQLVMWLTSSALHSKLRYELLVVALENSP